MSSQEGEEGTGSGSAQAQEVADYFQEAVAIRTGLSNNQGGEEEEAKAADTTQGTTPSLWSGNPDDRAAARYRLEEMIRSSGALRAASKGGHTTGSAKSTDVPAAASPTAKGVDDPVVSAPGTGSAAVLDPTPYGAGMQAPITVGMATHHSAMSSLPIPQQGPMQQPLAPQYIPLAPTPLQQPGDAGVEAFHGVYGQSYDYGYGYGYRQQMPLVKAGYGPASGRSGMAPRPSLSWRPGNRVGAAPAMMSPTVQTPMTQTARPSIQPWSQQRTLPLDAATMMAGVNTLTMQAGAYSHGPQTSLPASSVPRGAGVGRATTQSAGGILGAQQQAYAPLSGPGQQSTGISPGNGVGAPGPIYAQVGTSGALPSAYAPTGPSPSVPPMAGAYGVPDPKQYGPPSKGVSNSVWNALKLIVPFNSDAATPEKARAFWNSFAMNTHGLDDSVRLLAFQQRLKGKSGESWWNNSRIRDFATLEVRFYNRYISQSPEQLIEGLKKAKRAKGESVEEWGDRISAMCDAMNYLDDQMRYQYFLEGLCNKRLRAMLDNSLAVSIPEACELLLMKNMHLPVEEEDAFNHLSSRKTDEGDVESPLIKVLQQQMQLLMQLQQQQLPNGQTHGPVAAVETQYVNSVSQPPSVCVTSQYAAPVQQSYSMPAVPAVVAAMQQQFVAAVQQEDIVASVAQAVAANSEAAFRGIRMGPDFKSQEGITICGRCHRAGCSRATCSRQYGTCRRCFQYGHFAMECTLPEQTSNAQGNGNGYNQNGNLNGNRNGNYRGGNGGQGRRPSACYACNDPGHVLSQCPMFNNYKNAQAANSGGEGQGAANALSQP